MHLSSKLTSSNDSQEYVWLSLTFPKQYSDIFIILTSKQAAAATGRGRACTLRVTMQGTFKEFRNLERREQSSFRTLVGLILSRTVMAHS